MLTLELTRMPLTVTGSLDEAQAIGGEGLPLDELERELPNLRL